MKLRLTGVKTRDIQVNNNINILNRNKWLTDSSNIIKVEEFDDVDSIYKYIAYKQFSYSVFDDMLLNKTKYIKNKNKVTIQKINLIGLQNDIMVMLLTGHQWISGDIVSGTYGAFTDNDKLDELLKVLTDLESVDLNGHTEEVRRLKDFYSSVSNENGHVLVEIY